MRVEERAQLPENYRPLRSEQVPLIRGRLLWCAYLVEGVSQFLRNHLSVSNFDVAALHHVHELAFAQNRIASFDQVWGAAALRERGILVPAIRPPTVPRGMARLRISLSATHQQQDIVRLTEALKELALHA